MEESSAWERYKENLGSTRPWDLLSAQTKYVSKEAYSERLSICKGCPEFLSLTSQCKKCGCVMKLKAKLELAVCPINKW
jgi:hypothetical protein